MIVEKHVKGHRPPDARWRENPRIDFRGEDLR